MRTGLLSGCRKAVFLVLGVTASGSILAENDISVTPYRPTVSNPAALSEPGWLEVEAGLSRQKQPDGSRQTTLPYLLKYAFSPDFGILLGGDARVRKHDADGSRLSGQGDTLLMLKHRWALGEGDDAPAFGLEWGIQSPTARSGLNSGSGKTDALINGIFSTQIEGNTIDLNLGATRLGAHEAGSSATKWSWAGTLSRSLDERWSIAGELSGTARHGGPPENQALVALGYALSKRVVLDAGLSVGLSDAATDRSYFLGISFLLDKLR
jgi:hypothetical protein